MQQFLVSVLPGSQCQVDSSTGFVSIDVQRDDIRGLPRLFKWLEQSRNARRLVREWGISNTTLEQVFLMLCIQNTEVNYVERREDDQRNTLCPMCRQRQKTNVLMRNVTGSLMIVPSSLCGECANGNTDFTLPEDTLSRIQDDFGSPQSWANLSAERLSEIGTKLGKFYVALVEQAQSRAEQKHIDRMMASEGDELQHLLGDGELKVGDGEIKTDDVKDSVVAPAVLLTTDSQSQMMLTPNNFAAASFSSSSKGSPANQIYALAIKNVQLQYRQRCSNCCRYEILDSFTVDQLIIFLQCIFRRNYVPIIVPDKYNSSGSKQPDPVL